MPVTTLPPGTALDTPSAGGAGAQVTKLPADTKLDAGPSTTLGGIGGAATRGLAPIAAGAALGAAAGAPFAGIGAVPGAIAGAGAAGLSQFGGDIYNLAARQLNLPKMMTPQDAMDRVLDRLGIKRPQTGVEQAVETAAGVAPFGLTAVHELGDAVAKNSSAAVDRFIQSQYTRAIKPSVAGKGTASQLVDYNSRARGAIDSIVANKAALRFTDEAGETAGHLPKSIQQFADAIEQTKQSIFDRYDAMARQAGGVGAKVELSPVVGELQKLSADSVVRDLHPEVSAYAEDMAQRLAARGSYSTVDAQRAVQNLNNSLKAFYSNPTYETASRASIDAMVANQLRSGLDKAIEQATGPGYQELKNQYGGLKAIEKDVVHRAVVEGRKNLGGGIMGNIGDLASADEVIRGVLTLNPAAVARGAAIKGFTTFVKHLRDPNRAVSRLFDAADQQQRVREAARQAIPTEKSPPLLQLPAPEMAGQGTPWINTGNGLMPGSPGFVLKRSAPPPSANQ